MYRKQNKMRKLNIKGIFILLVVITVIGFINIPSFASEIDKAKEEKTNLEKKKEETELRISELEKDKNDILKYIEKLDMELNSLTEEMDALNINIENANMDLVSAQEELELTRVTEEDQYSIMKKRIKYMYEHGETSYLDLIMQAESMSDVLNQVEYMSKITEYDNSLLDKYTALKQDVMNKEKALETKVATLNGLKEELIYEQETVERLSQDKNKELVKYEESISEKQNLSAEYSSKLDEQEDVIEQLLEAERLRIEEEERKAEEERQRQEAERIRLENEKAANAGNNNSSNNNDSSNQDSGSSTATGDFIWPVPSSSRISSPFGYRDQPTAGASTNHKGIDISASSGSNIVAADSGSVTTAAYSVSAGNYIMISHGNGIYTVYMHCSKLLVSVGDQVSQGDVIALVGSTGFSTGAHLHFGISVNGTYVNPQDYVSY